MGMQWNNTRGLSVFLLGPCYQKAWRMGMRRWKRRACCMSWWRAHWWSCVRRFVAASRRGGRAVLPGCTVLGGLISLGIWTHLSLYFRVVFVRVWGLLKVGLCMDSSPRKRCMLARHLLIAHTVQVWLPVSQNISGVSVAQVSKMQRNPGIDFSGADYGCSFVCMGCVPPDFSNFSGRSIGNIDGGSDGQCEGCGGGTSAAPQRGQCQGPGSSSTAVELETAEEATMWIDAELLHKMSFVRERGHSR